MIKIVNEDSFDDYNTKSIVTEDEEEYMSSDELHDFVGSHMRELGFPDSYRRTSNVTIETRNHSEVFGGTEQTTSRFWRLYKKDNGEWDFYELDEDGWTV